MSEERKTRIVELEAEAQKLKAQEDVDRQAEIAARVVTLFQGLSYRDVATIRECVNVHARALYVLEVDDE